MKQFYENSEAFDMGKTKMNYDGVDIAFSDKSYIHRLDNSDKRWIDEEIGVVTEGILEFVSGI